MIALRLVAVCTALVLATPPTLADDGTLLLGPSYPLEVVVREHVGRFHWLDSLAGLELPGSSAGKTVGAHREQFVRLLGRPTDADRRVLRQFAEVRLRFAETRMRAWERDREADFSSLLTAFLEADDEAAALEAAAGLLPAEDLAALEAALDHFRPRYRDVWRAGAWAEPFLAEARDGADAARLADGLRRLAQFYGASLPLDPPPRAVFVPVPGGAGTHATARGRNLLIELRPDDRIADAASVIAHENAHLLFERMPERRRKAVEAVFLDHGDDGVEAWNLLREALPTALGQGVFDRRFRRRAWTERAPWYHREDVDRYAKAIFPVVRRWFERGRALDRGLARELWAAYADLLEVSRRSP